MLETPTRYFINLLELAEEEEEEEVEKEEKEEKEEIRIESGGGTEGR